jgi:hypothetical protein
MENCAFIDIFTTMNDLFGSNNCPIQFRCEMTTWKDLFSGLHGKSKLVCMVPDEKILGNGTAFHGFTNENIELLRSTDESWLALRNGLSQAHFIMSYLASSGAYVIGYGLKGYVIKILNENFERILEEKPVVFDEKKLIDVENLAKLLVDIRDCGNYNRNSVLASLSNISFDQYGPDKTLKTEMSKTRVVLTELITRGNLKTNGHMGSFEEVSDFLCSIHPVEYFQVGKYKGMKIEEAFVKDRQYFSWIMKNSRFFDEDKNLLAKVKDLLSSEDK